METHREGETVRERYRERGTERQREKDKERAGDGVVKCAKSKYPNKQIFTGSYPDHETQS